MNSKYILGIDTSNYRTSVSVVTLNGEIALDERTLLKVKKGERGLRQSDALFQHIENLPVIFEKLENKAFKFASVIDVSKTFAGIFEQLYNFKIFSGKLTFSSGTI